MSFGSDPASRFAVLGTGESLSLADIEKVRHKFRVIAVSDAFRLAPWAEALVSQDMSWWRVNSDALQFEGRKFSVRPDLPGIELLEPGSIQSGTNSGLAAVELARRLGATQIVLLGFDLHGTHFFGRHPETLKHTDAQQFARMNRQFLDWAKVHPVPVVNCSPGSKLDAFPRGTLEDLC